MAVAGDHTNRPFGRNIDEDVAGALPKFGRKVRSAVQRLFIRPLRQRNTAPPSKDIRGRLPDSAHPPWQVRRQGHSLFHSVLCNRNPLLELLADGLGGLVGFTDPQLVEGLP